MMPQVVHMAINKAHTRRCTLFYSEGCEETFRIGGIFGCPCVQLGTAWTMPCAKASTFARVLSPSRDACLHCCTVLPKVGDPEHELVHVVPDGTLNILHTCAKAPSVRKVIITSSTAAVVGIDR